MCPFGGFGTSGFAGKVRRVATHRMIRDLDLAVLNPGDLRRIVVIVDGLGVFGGAHIGSRRNHGESGPR